MSRIMIAVRIILILVILFFLSSIPEAKIRVVNLRHTEHTQPT